MARAIIDYDKNLPEISGRRPWDKPTSYLVKDDRAPTGWREAVRQVHALAEKGTRDWPGHTAFYALTEIHKITKGMVNNG